jgi:hypothetical protein
MNQRRHRDEETGRMFDDVRDEEGSWPSGPYGRSGARLRWAQGRGEESYTGPGSEDAEWATGHARGGPRYHVPGERSHDRRVDPEAVYEEGGYNRGRRFERKFAPREGWRDWSGSNDSMYDERYDIGYEAGYEAGFAAGRRWRPDR